MEFEDKNLRAVVKKAAKTLKVPEETLQYEVISYGSTGIFGLVGAKKARIRVITSNKEKRETKQKPVKGDVPEKGKVFKNAPGKAPGNPLRKPPVKTSGEPPMEPLEKPIDKPIEKPVVEEKLPSDAIDAVEKGRSVIQKIVDKITDDAMVQIENKDDGVFYRIEGGKTALIIGKRGQTLEAIQYLVDRVVNKNSEKRIRFQIDVGGYLENKKANLEQRALHLAEKVKKTGKPVTVGELNVYDRKIVHMCLKEDRDVRTQSMGSGFYRKLVIFPKKGNKPLDFKDK